MTKVHKYTGILAKPMGDTHWLIAVMRSRPNGGTESPARAKAVAEAHAEDNRLLTERLTALMQECGISLQNEDPWFRLALKLAERHVPGFSRKAKRGRGQPTKTPDYDLFDQMQRMMQRKGLPARSAAVHVARERKLGEKASAVEARYRRVKKHWEKIEVIVGKARQEIR